jgi:hypothetical protein
MPDLKRWIEGIDPDETEVLKARMLDVAKRLGERLASASVWHDLRVEDQRLVVESEDAQALLRRAYEQRASLGE